MRDFLSSKEDEIISEIIELTKLNISFSELCKKRVYFQNLFLKKNFNNAMIDGAGNVILEIPGIIKDEAIVIVSKLYSYNKNNGIKITGNTLQGINIINGVALYSLVILAELIKKYNLKHTVYFIGAARGLESIPGTFFALKNINKKINAFLDINGGNYLKVSSGSDEILRLRIDFISENIQNLSKTNIITSMSKYINKLFEESFFENIYYNFGEINAGNNYSKNPNFGYLKMEIRANNEADVLEGVRILKSLSKGIEKEDNLKIHIKEILHISGMDMIESDLLRLVKEYLKSKGVTLINEKWDSELIYAIKNNIANALSIGIGKGYNEGYDNEEIEIKSIINGYEYIFNMIKFIDENILKV